MILSVGAVLGYIGQIFAGKYYVTQQLAQMQAHNINRNALIEKSTGKTKKIITQIFNDYDKEIEAFNWCWVKQKNQLRCVPMSNGKMRGKNVTICESQRHDGIFPPLAAIAQSMGECTTRIGDTGNAFSVTKEKMKNWGQAYASNLEFWVLQLEALEQDMAITLKV